EKCDESICDSVRRSVHQANLVKSRPAGRQAITGPHTKNLTLPSPDPIDPPQATIHPCSTIDNGSPSPMMM
ncbi:hypothetical protein, partial [Pseudomonas sp. CM27]|uniref:hypothetical protein n=1 Tax=Pseudomonas sp. CM27 TaxID=2738452 RepID=UPI001C49AE24